MAGSECASLSGSAVVTVGHSTHSDSESVASASASEHESSYASSSLGDLRTPPRKRGKSVGTGKS